MPKALQPVDATDCARFIIEAAKELLAEVGYGAMSMRQLAARAGLLPGSLYHHVASKQDLLLCVLLNLLEARDSAWRQFPRRRGILGELQGFVRFVLAWQQSHPTDIKVLEHEHRHLDAPMQAWLAQRSNSLHTHLLGLLHKGREQGVFGDIDIDSAALAIMALLGTAEALRQRSEHWSAPSLEAHLLRMALRLLDLQPLVQTVKA